MHRTPPSLALLLVSLAVLLAGSCVPPSTTAASPTGTLAGVVIDPLTRRPIPGVRVRAHDIGEAMTDAEGRFVLELPAGDHHLWLDRAGFIDGRYARARVEAGRVTNLRPRLFPEAPSDALVSDYLARQPLRRHGHPAHDRPEAPAGGADNARLDETSGDVGGAQAALHEPPVLPAEIRVWRSSRAGALEPSSANGWADNSCNPAAMVETLPLEEYVKGVVTHEWLPSWHGEALRAGAIAARTYAVNWVARGGRWDCADVDDGTVTQVYRDDRTATGDEAVDATMGMVVMRGEAIISTEYSAENTDPTAFDVSDPTCTGTTLFGHGRGMCQWGTHRWATSVCANPPCDFGVFGAEPKGYVWMVEHYYPEASVVGGEAETVTPCKVIPSEGDILDDAGPCFDALGASAYWRMEDAGWNGGLLWTNAFEAAAPGNWARWRLHFAAPGEYTVDAFIDPAFGVHKTARYLVTHAGGEDEVLIDQGAADGWTRLGTWAFDAEAQVRLLDNEAGPVPRDQHIVADAIQVKPTGGDAGLPPADAGPPSPPPPPSGDGCRCGLGGPRGAPTLWWALLVGAVVVSVRRRRR